MATADLPIKQRGFGRTMRPDAWWAQPILVFLGLSTFIVYATWAALQGVHYTYGPYVSPFYSPELLGSSPHSLFGPKPGWWPHWLPFSAALLILWAPGGFRLTCYYYRGEKSFPLIMQNVHRFFLYVAIFFIGVLAYDVWRAMWFADPATGKESFGIGVGTIVLAINVVLLGGYTFGCHSLRHLIGGFIDQMSRAPVRQRAYNCASCLNRRHMFWAWTSLCSVMFADLYVRLCSMGVWKDVRLF